MGPRLVRDVPPSVRVLICNPTACDHYLSRWVEAWLGESVLVSKCYSQTPDVVEPYLKLGLAAIVVFSLEGVSDIVARVTSVSRTPPPVVIVGAFGQKEARDRLRRAVADCKTRQGE